MGKIKNLRVKDLISIFLSFYWVVTSLGVLAQTPEKEYEIGFFLYNNDDVSDKVAEIFQSLIRNYPNTPTAEEAAYQLGRYYQKKFYIVRNLRGIMDPSILEQAVGAYKAFIQTYEEKSSKKLADAYFYLALTYFELGNKEAAMQSLQHLVNSETLKDDQVRIDRLIWSRRPQDRIESTYNARELAKKTLEIFSSYPETPFQLRDSKELAALTLWCKNVFSRNQAQQAPMQEN
jgi:tetratricopeptide (TPR) repeat protein